MPQQPRPPRPRLPEGFQYPVMAKASSGGYDGRGTAVLRHDDDLGALLQNVTLSRGGVIPSVNKAVAKAGKKAAKKSSATPSA